MHHCLMTLPVPAEQNAFLGHLKFPAILDLPWWAEERPAPNARFDHHQAEGTSSSQIQFHTGRNFMPETETKADITRSFISPDNSEIIQNMTTNKVLIDSDMKRNA